MKSFVPYEKLSAKEKRRIDRERRGSWNGICPVTRKPANPKAYNRAKAKRQTGEEGRVPRGVRPSDLPGSPDAAGLRAA